ncbi:MAG: arylesterase [Gemmatimonadetes bacterium]|nr:arylesterase [Gemmatimonadota bacterium]
MVRSSSLAVLALHVLGCGPADDAGATDGGSTAAPPPAVASGGVERAPDGERAASDPDGRRGPRVVFMGTSLTAGLGLSDPDDRFTDRLQALADSAGVPARMINLGVSGETSAGGLRRLAWALADTVDVLVLELGANDGLRGQDPDALEANLRAIVDSTRARWPGAVVILAGMEAPPNLGERYTRRFREVFARVAREEDTVLIPFLLEGVAGEADLNQDDRIHPNVEGHRRIARTVWPVL